MRQNRDVIKFPDQAFDTNPTGHVAGVKIEDGETAPRVAVAGLQSFVEREARERPAVTRER